MAKMYRCDRCKKLFPESEINSGCFQGFWQEDMDVDLCDDCRGELDEFVHGDDKKDEK